MEALTSSALSALIGSIYDCALTPSSWRGTLGEIARACGSEKALLSVSDLENARVLISESYGWEPKWLEERAKYVVEIDALLSEWFASPRTKDEPFVASRSLPASQAAASAYVRDCLAPQGIGDVAHYVLVRTPAHSSELVLSHAIQHGPFTDRELELGRLLLPHLRRALTIGNVLELRGIERERMAETLDALHCGVVLTSEHAVVLHANRAAIDFLGKGSVLASPRGKLRAKSPSASSELRDAIRRCTLSQARIDSAGVGVRLTDSGSTPIFAHVVPLASRDGHARTRREAVAAVFITAAKQDNLDTFAAAFGLTKAEKRVVACLLGGRTLSAAAQELGIARTTTKTHLDNVFRKTGASRQAELIRLISRTAPPA